jgi:hypothetical protein
LHTVLKEDHSSKVWFNSVSWVEVEDFQMNFDQIRLTEKFVYLPNISKLTLLYSQFQLAEKVKSSSILLVFGPT